MWVFRVVHMFQIVAGTYQAGAVPAILFFSLSAWRKPVDDRGVLSASRFEFLAFGAFLF